jgi:hypothetical protein
MAQGTAATMVSNALERLLRGSDRREFYRSVVHGHAQHRAAPAPEEQHLQESVRVGNRAIPHERRRYVADGGLLGSAGRGWRARPSVWSEERHRLSEHRQAAASSPSACRWARRIARIPNERICGCHPTRPQAVSGCGTGVEYDGGRYRDPPVSAAGRGTYEDPTVCHVKQRARNCRHGQKVSRIQNSCKALRTKRPAMWPTVNPR